MCKMQIAHKKGVNSPSLCFPLYNSGAVSCTIRKCKGWFTGVQVNSGFPVKRALLLKELKIPQHFWVKKDFKTSLMELMAMVVSLEMDVLRQVGITTKIIPVW